MTRSMHTDIQGDDWVERYLPHSLRPYARLMRVDRPIGTWLLLWPCLWSLALASQGFPDLYFLILFALGSVIMRGAGCVINDLYDRDLDGHVERTKSRPLVSGQVTFRQGLIFTLFLFLLGAVVLFQFNSFAVWLGLGSLPIVALYPLAKRVTWWPQFVLGLAFNWGALMGWASVHASLQVPALLLYIGGIFWTLGYDTIYAHQDKHDDRLVGIKSLALFLGDRSRFCIALFYAVFLFFVFLSATTAGVGPIFYYIFAGAFAHAAWQLVTWQMDDPANCLSRFRSNRDMGFIIFVAIVCGRFWL